MIIFIKISILYFIFLFNMTNAFSVPVTLEWGEWTEHIEPLPPGQMPTKTFIQNLKSAVYRFARSIHKANYGGDMHALCSVTDQPTYHTLTGSPAVPLPHNPPTLPDPWDTTAAETMTGPVFTRRYADWQRKNEQYALHKQIQNFCNTKIREACGDTFLLPHIDPTFGLVNVNTHDLLAHLNDNYANPTRLERMLNRAKLLETFDATQPPEHLFHRYKLAQDFAATGDVISDELKIDSALTALEKTGKYTEAIVKFDKRAAADQTWDNLKSDVTEHYRVYKESMLTTAQAGYHGANAASTVTPNQDAIDKFLDSIGLYYCYTHGLTHVKGHTSANCNYPHETHDKTATIANMKGGKNIIKRIPHEKSLIPNAPRRPRETDTTPNP